MIRRNETELTACWSLKHSKTWMSHSCNECLSRQCLKQSWIFSTDLSGIEHDLLSVSVQLHQKGDILSLYFCVNKIFNHFGKFFFNFIDDAVLPFMLGVLMFWTADTVWHSNIIYVPVNPLLKSSFVGRSWWRPKI